MWRIASLYIIGKQLNRTIYFESIHPCLIFKRQELMNIFSNKKLNSIKIMYPNNNHVKIVSFDNICCKYESPLM
ncbi:hypothetical protein Mgra_00009836 [Meloidogyne graminicola]|uniref:Uncharacterized protein n=1 Tax=Meloidogyne graminicola TaxID=189291 RepID=A0A8S9ZD77_9BILA|nr:hypothetical protein Mgra_00009836 [Meloidogyne graminicola]